MAVASTPDASQTAAPENKIPFVAAVSLDEKGRAAFLKLHSLASFTLGVGGLPGRSCLEQSVDRAAHIAGGRGMSPSDGPKGDFEGQRGGRSQTAPESEVPQIQPIVDRDIFSRTLAMGYSDHP